MQGILSSQKENVAAAEKEAARGIEERVKERSDIKEKLLGKDTETAEYRKSIMDEKANAPDEARRQLGMRLMQFGANWASTPGAPLIAGMKALKDTLPDVMEDTKESKNMMKDLDKSVYLLNHSERLDAEGRIDAAAKAREDASKLVMDHKQLLVTYGLKVAEVQEKSKQAELDRISEEKRTGISAAATKYAADARGSGSRADSLVALGPKIVSNDKAMADVSKRLSRYLSSDEYAAKNADKVAELKKELVVLKKRDLRYKSEKNDINMAEEVDTENASGAGVKTAQPAAIEYLKANPNAKEQFKQKFGYLPEGM
jgi:hypothetical protein